MEEQKEIRNYMRALQERYVYYLIALAVTSIGFAIYKTSGQSLNWIQVTLGLSILSWGTSIHCGFTFIKYHISTLYANNAYFEIIKGQDQSIDQNPSNILAKTNAIKEAMRSNVNVAGRYFYWQQKLFYIGMISFIIWHISEMYMITLF